MEWNAVQAVGWLNSRNSATKTAVNVALAGAFFAIFDFIVAHGPPRRWLRRLFRNLGPSKAEAAVNQAVARLTGALHVLLQIPLAVWVLSDREMMKDRLYGTSTSSFLMVVISGGYFLHDLIDCMRRQGEEGLVFVLHAAAAFVVFSYGVYTGFLHYYGAMFLMWELSTPFVHMRWFMHKLGKASSRAYVINGMAMMLVFFLCRNVYGSVLTVDFFLASMKELAQPRPGGLTPLIIWLYRFNNLVLMSLNTFWLYKMITGAVKIVFQGGKEAKDGPEWNVETRAVPAVELATGTIAEVHKRGKEL